MKRTLLLSIFLFGLTTFAFTQALPKLEFSSGLTSGQYFYKNKSISVGEESIPYTFTDGRKIDVGFLCCTTLNFTDYFAVYFDGEYIFDLNSFEKKVSNHFDYSISSGVKFYPFSTVPGFTSTVGYLLGSKTDIIKTDSSSEKIKIKSPWGNGFKMGVEFNLYHFLGSKFLPTIGCCWRHIPRGNEPSDNSINAYLLFTL